MRALGRALLRVVAAVALAVAGIGWRGAGFGGGRGDGAVPATGPLPPAGVVGLMRAGSEAVGAGSGGCLGVASLRRSGSGFGGGRGGNLAVPPTGALPPDGVAGHAGAGSGAVEGGCGGCLGGSGHRLARGRVRRRAWGRRGSCHGASPSGGGGRSHARRVGGCWCWFRWLPRGSEPPPERVRLRRRAWGEPCGSPHGRPPSGRRGWSCGRWVGRC